MQEIIHWIIILFIVFFVIPFIFDRVVRATEPKGKYKKKTNKPLATAVKCGVGWQGYTGSGLWGTEFKTGTCKTLTECKSALEAQGYEVRVHKLVP